MLDQLSLKNEPNIVLYAQSIKLLEKYKKNRFGQFSDSYETVNLTSMTMSV